MQEWLCNIETVFKYLKYPVVSMGIIKYCKVVTMETSYFKVKSRDMSASFEITVWRNVAEIYALTFVLFIH